MITKFRIFEETEDRILYNVGDYVILDLNEEDVGDIVPEGTKVAKISKVKPIENNEIYYVKFYNGTKTSVIYEEIERLATPEEVLEDEVLNTRNKYNL
jgi:hypothetical protein